MQDQTSSWMRYLWHRMWLKHKASHKDMWTDLIRCLSTWQLTLLGVGNTIGVGIYVLLGVMVKEEAGPSTIFAFLIAIVVTWMNAMVFAEFSTYVPQTGAAYMFLYKVYGEFAAFIVGSLLICSGLLCTSVGARAWSGMLDSFFNNTLQDGTVAVLGEIELGPPFAEKLDIVAFIFQAVITGVVMFNIFCTSIINTVLGILTSSVLIFVFGFGIFYGDSHNFFNSEHGGFFPFGAVGVIKAASMGLYAMSGFEVISMSSEECKNPAKSIPRAMVAELIIVGLVYIGAATSMMFLIPYWMVDLRAPLPSAFEHSGHPWGKMIVTVGPMFGITNLQMLALYGISRFIYRMSKDGLIFSVFLAVDSKTGVPQRAVLFAGVFTSFFALVCDLSFTVKMSLVLMLLSYISVASALICLKVGESNNTIACASSESQEKKSGIFRDEEERTLFSQGKNCSSSLLSTSASADEDSAEDGDVVTEPNHEIAYNSNHRLTISGDAEELDIKEVSLQNSPATNEGKENSIDLEFCSGRTQPADQSHHSRSSGVAEDKTFPHQGLPSPALGVGLTNVLMLLHLITCVTLSGQVIYGHADLVALRPVAVFACGTLIVLMIIFSVLLGRLIARGAAHSKEAVFKTPWMPLVPTCSIVLSSMMLFSAAEKIGSVEVLIMTALIAVMYVLMTLARFHSDRTEHVKGPALLECQEQEMRLISSDGEAELNFDDDG